MIRCRVRIVVVVLGAWLTVEGGGRAVAEDFGFYHENVMGTSLELIVRADDVVTARRAEGRVLSTIDRLSRVFSDYDPSSEFRRWQKSRAASVAVSAELLEVLAMCDHWRAVSGGAFDPRVEILSRLWSATADEDRTPRADEVARAQAFLSRPTWRLDPRGRTAERLSDGPMSLNAIAKGYIVEKAVLAATADGQGVHGLMLNVGGDLRIQGALTWTIGIAAPRGDSETTRPVATIEVRDRAVATSGSTQRGFRIKGRWYSHVFDPRTGAPAAGVLSATVVAPRSADADALATALNVLSPAEGVLLVEATPGAACLILSADGRVMRSPGWSRFEQRGPSLLAFADEPQAPDSKSWGDRFELRVDFEINRPDATGGRYRRPYVAVWVENEAGFPIRNLILWVSQGGSGPFQWLPDLKRWYVADQSRKKTADKTEMVLTISRPTRPPGKYSVVWNGKDDHGKAVSPGAYTICIDAAREHGTSQSIRIPVTLNAKPFSTSAKGNVEIKSASIDYRRKASAK